MNLKFKTSVSLSWFLLAVLLSTQGLAASSEVNIAVNSSCDLMQSSGGSVDASLDILTRPVGTSPETVYFSAQQSADPNCLGFSGGNDIEACRTPCVST